VSLAAAALCISVGTALHRLPLRRFTLTWQHTVEKQAWQEDYVLAGDWLFLSAARIRGSGAGMEPPPGAQLVDGAWIYRPADPWRRSITLARSEFGEDYRLCVAGRCRPPARVLGGAAGPATLQPCAASPQAFSGR
jgi:hypothetical protein